MSDFEREAFEKAAKRAGYCTDLGGRNRKEYLYEEVQTAWEIWQAARQGGEVEPVGIIELSDYVQINDSGPIPRRKALAETSEGSIQNLPSGTKLYTHPPAPDHGVPERVLKALRFYEEKARLCRKITDEGEEARAALDKDGGESARFALSYAEAAQNHPGGEWLRRSEIRDRLFSGWQGCSNHDCIITGPKKGMGTNGSCGCLHNASRTQLSILKARIQSMMEPPKDKQEGA